MLNDRFGNFSLESTEFLLEAVESPKIKAGASSSSNILNRYFEALSRDLTTLAVRSNLLAERARRVVDASLTQGAATQAMFQSLSARVDAASGYDQVLADMHSMNYVEISGTTARIETVFGQATLPVRSVTDLLVQNDVYGNPYVFSGVEVLYATGPSPSSADFRSDPNGIAMLSGLQAWLRPEHHGEVWVLLKAPLQFRGLTPNVLEIWPLPCWGMDLEEVAYLQAGESYSPAWVQADLSYLTGYVPSSGVVMAGPVRLHLDNVPISQVRMKFRTRSSTPWGLGKVRILHTQYEQTGQLVVKDPYSRTAGSPILRGKDPADLSSLTRTAIGNTVSVSLRTTTTSKTPVITGVIFSVV